MCTEKNNVDQNYVCIICLIKLLNSRNLLQRNMYMYVITGFFYTKNQGK